MLQEGCKSLGIACQYVCLNCGNPVPQTPSTDRDAISVISAKQSILSIDKTSNCNQDNKSQNIGDDQQLLDSSDQKNSSMFILQSLCLDENAVKVVEDNALIEV